MMSEATDKVGWGTESTLHQGASRWHKLTLAAMLAWIGTFMGATFLLGDEYYATRSPGAYAAAGLSILLGVLAIYTYWTFLRRSMSTTPWA